MRGSRRTLVGRAAARAGALSCLIALSTPVLATATEAARPLPSFLGCFGTKPAIRPRSIQVACGDGTFFVTHIRWSRWTPAEAMATGVGRQNDCKPDCAAGHFHSYPVSLVLSRPESCARRLRLFTRFAYRFVSRTPPGVARAGRSRAPFVHGHVCP